VLRAPEHTDNRNMRTLICIGLTVSMALPAAAQDRATPTPLLDSGRKEVARRVGPSALQPAPSPQQGPSQRSWPARHPVLLGTLTGTGIGLGMLAAQGCGSSDYTCGGLMLFAGGTGAALGALGGVVAAFIIR
jgi:hypothetical protein